ncbi:MAG: hypothetical protein M0009_05290 [Deltaproteobacteria bacterium]|nr:hypothetical protein [Deltaproteobacteria bacterium]
MKTGLRIVTLTVMLSFFAFLSPLSAQTLGDKIAAKLCYENNRNSYTLTSDEAAQWPGQRVSGSYSATVDGVDYSAHFSKAEQQDESAACTKTKVTSNRTCSRWSIVKSGKTLIKNGGAVPCRD